MQTYQVRLVVQQMRVQLVVHIQVGLSLLVLLVVHLFQLDRLVQ